MADIKLNYMSNGVEQIKKDYELIKKESKKITESPTKVTMKTEGVKETIDAMGRLRVEIPKLEQVYASLQNKSSSVAKAMARDIKNLKAAFTEINDIINKQGKVSGSVYDGMKNAGGTEAQLGREKLITEELEKQSKIRQNQEKELNDLRVQLQGISRTLSDQQNALATGKKGKTTLDIANLLQQLEQGTMRAEELAKALGEDNEAVQHFRNGMAWTADSNPLLKADMEALEELETRFGEIRAKFQESIDKLGDDSNYKQYIKDIEQTLTLLEQQAQKETDIKVNRQNALSSLELQQQKEKEYLSLLQQKFQLENKLTNLEKDKKSTRQNQNQIQEYQKQIQLINQKLQKISQETQFTNKTKKAVDELTQAHRNEQNAIIAKNKDIEKTNGLLSGTLGNFMKFTGYYAVLSALKQGINEALDTMRELDKAFTDIQMVTNGTDEETAQLAKEYNSLAKEMGSTTVEVAEGAGEWLRQGKTAAETTDLLRASMTLSKVGAIESSQATQLLTSSLNGYKIEAQDAMIGTVSSVTRRSAETIRRII